MVAGGRRPNRPRAASHTPFILRLIGIGCNAFYWEQFTGDSGSDATLGDFEGRSLGIGSVLSYVSPPIGGHTLSAELKWLPELDLENRREGDYIWWPSAAIRTNGSMAGESCSPGRLRPSAMDGPSAKR